MAATAEVLAKRQTRAISLRWIISARDDLIWLIGSVLSSYALLALYVSGVIPLVPMVALWAILIDAPHVFGTFSRTYFDKTEWQSRRRLLLGSLLFFAVGPVIVLAGAGFIFFFLAALWAYYHLVKQHYGFMVLYKKKNDDLAPIDNALDRLLLLFAFNYPFVEFIARDPEAMARVPVPLQSFVNILATILLAGTIILAVAWLIRQIQRAVIGEPLNAPKYLLLAAAIPMHWVVLLTPMPHKPIAIVAILTIYHNLQYHRLIWFHNKKYQTSRSSSPTVRKGASGDGSNIRSSSPTVRKGVPSDGTNIRSSSPTVRKGVPSDGTNIRSSSPTVRKGASLDGTNIRSSSPTVRKGVPSDDTNTRANYGPATFISRRLLYYIAFGILFGLIYQVPRQYLGYTSLRNDAGGAAYSLPTQLGISFLWGYAFIHYYLDSKIWRVRRDPSVGKALNMA